MIEAKKGRGEEGSPGMRVGFVLHRRDVAWFGALWRELAGIGVVGAGEDAEWACGQGAGKKSWLCFAPGTSGKVGKGNAVFRALRSDAI